MNTTHILSPFQGLRGGGGKGLGGTYDWQAKAMPQIGRQRKMPSQHTILTRLSHKPLSSPRLNENSTIWGREGGREESRGSYGMNRQRKEEERSWEPVWSWVKEWTGEELEKMNLNKIKTDRRRHADKNNFAPALIMLWRYQNHPLWPVRDLHKPNAQLARAARFISF